jgi:hypothetical protein
MKIAFPPGEYSVLRRNCVAFPAELDGKRITCRISFSALMDFPDAHRRHHLTTFRVHRTAIEQQAAALIERSGNIASDVNID